MQIKNSGKKYFYILVILKVKRNLIFSQKFEIVYLRTDEDINSISVLLLKIEREPKKI